LLVACAEGRLSDAPAPEWDPRACATVIYAANGYPDEPLTGSVIRGVERADAVEDVVVFHAGTRRDEDGLLRANGGRVLAVTALGDDLKHALNSAYHALDRIDWPGGFYRRDIGWRAL
jgi:phosphoribosylamine--glycine ligase